MDRDCENCKYRSEGGCSQWDCNFEPKEKEEPLSDLGFNPYQE